MPASPNDPRTKRRKAAGDDPNKTIMAPQPLPGMPQDQKGGNVENYPMTDFDGQMGQQIGSGQGQLPYGDMQIDAQARSALGSIGFTNVSGMPQNIVPGRGQNSMMSYNQPGSSLDPQQMAMMEPQYDMNAAAGLTMPNGLNNRQPVSYQITALGPTGQSAPDPGQTPPNMTYSMPDDAPIQGVQSAESVVGMSLGRGGGRNRGKA